jgi:hypothetical protein
MYVRTYADMATFVEAKPDNAGGAFFSAVTNDTVCSFSNSIAQFTRVSPSGTQVWRSDLFYDNPCLSQNTNSLCIYHANIYTSVSDTSGHLVRFDTSGAILTQRDTSPIFSFALISQDPAGNIVSAVFPQTTSSLISHDSVLNLRWTYNPSYSFICDFKKILCDKNGQRVALFDYTDNTQAETRGIGLIRLDTNGAFLWDTFINPQVSPADADWCVDAEIDSQGNVYVLSEDSNQGGVYLHKVDATGHVIGSAQYVIPAPLVDPKDIELDTVHGVVYVTGRKPGTIVRLKYDLNLNALDTAWVVTQQNGKFAQRTNEYGYFYHWWINQNAATKEVVLDVYNHAGQMVDSYSYWDSTRFQDMYPEEIFTDSLGNIFGVCFAKDPANNDVIAIFKFINPLAVSSETNRDNSLNVFPNPASGNVTVAGSFIEQPETISIRNTAGQCIYADHFVASTYSLDTRLFSSGLYFIEVITASGECYTQKLVINHQ